MNNAFSAPVTLQEQMQQTQQRLWQNMAHSEMNGVEVIRELGRLRGSQRQPLMPVVFTSMLGMTLEGMTIDQGMSHLFGEEQRKQIGSTAVVALNHLGLHGVLAVGSRDPQHYKSSVGMLFLGHIAEVLGRVLPRFTSALRSVR